LELIQAKSSPCKVLLEAAAYHAYMMQSHLSNLYIRRARNQEDYKANKFATSLAIFFP